MARLLTLLLALAMALKATALPRGETKPVGIAERQAGPAGAIPEIIMVAVVDAGGPAVEAFGLGAQITKELFGDLDQSEPYVCFPLDIGYHEVTDWAWIIQKDSSNCRMEIHTDDSSCTMKTWAKGDTSSNGQVYEPSECAFGTPVTYTDPVVGDYVLNFKSTSCPNSNKCDPVVDFNSHWYANGTQTGIELDFGADDDDGDFQGSGKTFLCNAGENSGYFWLCAVPCGQIKPNSRGYAPGWCGIHVVQYQRNEGPAASTGGTSDYRLDVILYDANQNEIGGVKLADAPSNQAVSVDSMLPLVMEVTAGNVDSDPVTFSYGDQSWAYADSAHHCNFGQYDSGTRQGDCGFTC